MYFNVIYTQNKNRKYVHATCSFSGAFKDPTTVAFSPSVLSRGVAMGGSGLGRSAFLSGAGARNWGTHGTMNCYELLNITSIT